MDNLTARRLQQCREDSHETLEDISKLIGVNKSTVMRWENGDTTRINLATVHTLAAHFHVNPLWLQGQSDDPTESGAALSTDSIPVPIIGAVRAGYGGIVFEEPLGHEPVEAATLRSGDDYFWLHVTGDSMTPEINDRDIVLVRRQDSVDSGQYAVVLVDGEEGLVKQVVYGNDWIELHSINPCYPPRRFEGADVRQITVIGRVIESRHKFI